MVHGNALGTCKVIRRIIRIQKALLLFANLHLNPDVYPQRANLQEHNTFDYVVAGGGTTGIVIASRLAEANSSVLLVEAGTETPSIDTLFPGLVKYVQNSRIDWNFTAEPDTIAGKCLCRKYAAPVFGKVLGGSSATDVMIYGRANRRDYDKIFKITNDPSWKWDNMLKYYKKSEKLRSSEILNSSFKKYHGTKGKIGVTKENRTLCVDYLKGFEDAGEPVVIDNVGPSILGYSRGLYNILDGVRSGVTNTYLPPLKDNPNFKMTLGSLATKIKFDEDKNAVGLEILRGDKTIHVKARKEIIVTTGPIKTPQLLMLSGVGPKKELKDMRIPVISNLPVGKNLNNVASTVLCFKTNRKADPKPFNAHLHPWPLIVGHAALNKTSTSADYETQNFIFDDHNEMVAFCGFVLGFEKSICNKLLFQAEDKQVLCSVVTNINTKSRGEVLLHSTNPKAYPRIIGGYYTIEDDLVNQVEYILDFMKIQDGKYFTEMGLEFLPLAEKCNRFKLRSKEYWRCYALCLHAITGRNCGTCAIGSVVNAKLKVMGVERVRVVDASAFPNSVGGAIFAPKVALAEKAAEMIINSNEEY